VVSPKLKPLIWMGSSKKDLSKLPREVQKHFGFALRLAQQGLRHADAKTLKGFGGGAVIEVLEDFNKDTYRAVYTVKFEGIVYALHAFQKKSKEGHSTPKADMDLIRKRLKDAEAEHRRRASHGQ
jgi:phage-related protein